MRRPVLVLLLVLLTALPAPGAEDKADESGRLLPVLVMGDWGYIDGSGEMVIQPAFDRAEEFDGAHAMVSIDGFLTLIDRTGKPLFLPGFAKMGQSAEGLVPVERGGRWGYVDLEGEFIIEPRFSLAREFSEGLAAVRQENGRWGFIDRKGEWKIKPEFEIAMSFAEGRAFVKADQRGLNIDRTGRESPKTPYPWVDRFSEGLAPFCTEKLDENGRPPKEQSPCWGFIDESGTVVIEPIYSEAWDFENGVAQVFVLMEDNYQLGTTIDRNGSEVKRPYIEGGDFHDGLARAGVRPKSDGWNIPPLMWGFVDNDESWVIEPKYLEATDFSRGRTVVRTEDNQWLAIDRDCNVKFSLASERWGEPERVEAVAPGIFRARYANPLALIDSSGSIVGITDEYEEGRPFSDGVSVVRLIEERYSGRQTWAVVDRRLNRIVTFDQGDKPLDCSDGRIVVDLKNIGMRIIDKQGNIVIESFRGWAERFAEGLSAVHEYYPSELQRPAGSRAEGAFYGFMDKTGRLVAETSGPAESLSQGLAVCILNGRYGYVDRDGEWVIPPSFEEAERFNEGLAHVRRDGRWGFISPKGLMLIDARFERAGEFSDGMALIQRDRLLGYVNRLGREVVLPQYRDARPFSDGFALIDGQRGRGHPFFIDTSGRRAFDLELIRAEDFSGGLAAVMAERGYWEYIDTTGKVATNLNLREAGQFSEGLAWVRLANPVAFFDLEGDIIWETPFEVQR